MGFPSQKVCSTTMVEENAISIKLFDGSIWTNILYGKFLNIESKKEESITRLYKEIKTVVGPGKRLIAKRKHKSSDLFMVPRKKVKNYTK